MKIRFYFENEQNVAQFFVESVHVDCFILKKSPPSELLSRKLRKWKHIRNWNSLKRLIVCSTSKLVQLEPKQKAGDDENIL